MDDQYEFQLRRRAIRLWLRGAKPKAILEKVQRGWTWLSKWRTRFEQAGRAGLKSESRRPQHTPTACAPRLVQLIVRTRRRLVKQKVGLIGARAVRRELRQLRLGKQMPSLATIKRVLHRQGLVATPTEAASAYFPKPLATVAGRLHALDWTCRYLEDGPKVYAFHTLNLHTRACSQTIATCQSSE